MKLGLERKNKLLESKKKGFDTGVWTEKAI